MEPFVGEIRLMSFAFDTSEGWLLCDGRLLPISQYQALYSLLGTYYGGDGKTTFGIPDLRGRVAVHYDQTQHPGTPGGVETVALSSSTMPSHSHAFFGSSAAADKAGIGTKSSRLLGVSAMNLYGPPQSQSSTPMNSGCLATAGGGAAHQNMQPSLVVAYCIATQGLYPTRE